MAAAMMRSLRVAAPEAAHAPARSLAPRPCVSRRAGMVLHVAAPEAPQCSTAKPDLRAARERANAAMEDAKMMCYQCEQTSNNGTGCTTVGNCGKTPEVAAQQDLLIFACKGLGTLAHLARTEAGIEDRHVNVFLNSAVFSTLTNVNFDDQRFVIFINEACRLAQQLQAKVDAKGVKLSAPADADFLAPMPHPMRWVLSAPPMGSVADTIELGEKTGIIARQQILGKTLAGLQELVTYGLKGLCAYAHHAEALGRNDPAVYAYVQRALAFLASPDARDVSKVLACAFECGEVNLRVMKMLSEGHSDTFGHPTPTPVSTVPVPGKALLVTGHDMEDLRMILEQTKDTGVNVYTHGEMLPAHGYPGLKKYPHLVGHYGGAWYRQRIDFDRFPGAVLVTTNCVLDPLQSYKANVFTINETGVSGVSHIPGEGAQKDFGPAIRRAQALPGFTQQQCDALRAASPKTEHTAGFGHHAVLGVADKVIDAIQKGQLEHIFLIGGCDGAEPQRKYYANLYKHMPESTIVLTLGCAKFRIIDQEWGTVPGTGLPRLLDMGQCNDSYSAIVVATELAKALKTDVNSLPLSLDLSWFEQKAVAVLLTLLHLGIRNIRLGPRLPAFLTEEALQVLVDKFNLMPADTANPEKDLKMMMACN